MNSLVHLPTLSVTEYAVLGILEERPSHGFAISKELAPEVRLGRILTVRRPLVYRALDRLVREGLAEPVHAEPGEAGPQRVIHRITRAGTRHLRRWVSEPVGHIRNLRIEFLMKVALQVRAGVSVQSLVESQIATLQDTFAAIESQTPGDHVELWRWHNARAAAAFLQEMARLFASG